MKPIAIAVLTLCLFSCSSEETETAVEYEYFIQGVIDDRREAFPQEDIPAVNTSNTYFTNFQQTWLQAYGADHGAKNQLWTIRISDVDIQNITLPYSDWENATASVSWDNDLTRYDDRCGIVDGSCVFAASTLTGLNLVITGVEDNIITGTFYGRMTLIGTGFGRFRDESIYVDVEEGEFNIQFRVDDN